MCTVKLDVHLQIDDCLEILLAELQLKILTFNSLTMGGQLSKYLTTDQSIMFCHIFHRNL